MCGVTLEKLEQIKAEEMSMGIEMNKVVKV